MTQFRPSFVNTMGMTRTSTNIERAIFQRYQVEVSLQGVARDIIMLKLTKNGDLRDF